MGQLDFNVQSPTAAHVVVVDDHLAVAVAGLHLKRHILKPGLMFKGKCLKPGAFQAMGQQSSTCTAPPGCSCRGPTGPPGVALQVVYLKGKL
jgi:hypothetical protein